MTRASTWGPEQRRRERELIDQLHLLAPDDPQRARVRDELVTMHLPLVRHLAARYRGRGESVDDLVQVGSVGLISAVDRYDPARGVELASFATPTILGEIKRHFRDHAWAIRVPRGLQELSARVTRTVDDLTRDLGRSPTVREVARELGIEEDEVLAALEARHALSADSLTTADGDGGEGDRLGGALDPAFEEIEEREALRPLLEALPARERRILSLRFAEGMSQTQIAQELGISQMQVSRLLARTLEDLRSGLLAA